MDLPAKRPVAVRRPALRTPPSSRAQYDVALCVESAQELQNKRLLQRRDGKQKRGDAPLRSCTVRKLAVLIGNMRGGNENTVGVQGWHAKFANGVRRESDAARHSSEKGEYRRFPEPLIVDGRCEFLFRKDRKSTRLNSSHSQISYAVFCLKK